MKINESNIQLITILLCKINQRTRFSHISNFKRLVVAVVETSTSIIFEPIFSQKPLRLRFCENPCFEKSLRLRFCENMRIPDFREPQHIKV